jgi:hypothetical protein
MEKKSKVSAWLPAMALSFCSACSSLYSPSSHNAPVLLNKGDIQINAGIGTRGYQADIAGALLNHVGMIGSYRYHESSEFLSDESDTEQNFQFGLGYFRKQSKDTHKNVAVFVGYQQGSVRGLSTYDGFFIQPQIGYRSRVFDAALSVRIDQVYVQAAQSHILYTIEPAATLGFGREPLKLCMQIGVLAKMNNYSPMVLDPSYRPNMCLGLRFNWNVKRARTAPVQIDN